MFRIDRVIADAEASKASYLWSSPTSSEQRTMVIFRVNFPLVIPGMDNMITTIRNPVDFMERCC